MPRQRRKPRDLPPLTGQDPAISSAGRAWRADRFGRLSGLCDSALLRFIGRQADRSWQDSRRMPDAAAPRVGRNGGGRHRNDAAAVQGAGPRNRHYRRRLPYPLARTISGRPAAGRLRRQAAPGNNARSPEPNARTGVPSVWESFPSGGLLEFRSFMTRNSAGASRRWAIGQILLLAAGFLVLVAISTASVLLVNKAREDSRWVLHTVEVENQINTLLLDVRRAESTTRGYLLTSEPQLLSEHEAATASIIP